MGSEQGTKNLDPRFVCPRLLEAIAGFWENFYAVPLAFLWDAENPRPPEMPEVLV